MLLERTRAHTSIYPLLGPLMISFSTEIPLSSLTIATGNLDSAVADAGTITLRFKQSSLGGTL